MIPLAVEIDQWLRSPVALQRTAVQFPELMLGGLHPSVTLVPMDLMLSSGLQRHVYTHS